MDRTTEMFPNTCKPTVVVTRAPILIIAIASIAEIRIIDPKIGAVRVVNEIVVVGVVVPAT
jgi:hypothetical protein